ncbi:MAG: acyl-CoA thioesterase [Terriglobia bacterium]
MPRKRARPQGKRRAAKSKARGPAPSSAPPGLPESGKPVSLSRSEYTEVVLPGQTNPLGNVLGGHVMHLIDITAAIAAHRHSNSYAATVAVDYLDFRHPIKVGQLILLKSSVNRTWRTSMEVGVKVFAEDVLTGERRHTSSAYVTFVAIDEHAQPQSVPPVLPETEEDQRRYREAEGRRQARLAHRYRRARP